VSVTDTPRPGYTPPTPLAHAETRLPRRVVLGFLLLTSPGTGVVLSILGPTVPAIAARLGVPEAALGVVFTASFLSATVTTAGTGALLDRVGARVLIPGGLLAMLLGLVGEGTAGALALVLLAAVLAGAGTGVINVAVNAAAARLYPARRDAVLTWLNVCFGIGAFLTPLAAGLSLTRLGGYAPAYLAGAVLLALPVLPLFLGLPAASAETVRPSPSTAAAVTLLRDRNLRLLMLLGGLYLGAEIGFGGWVVSIVAAMAHRAAAQAAPAASAFWLCLALGGAPTAYLLHRGIPARRLIVLGALVATAGVVLLLALGQSAPLAIACCALIGLAFAPILPLTTAQAVGRGVASGSDGARIAAVFTAGQLGAATLPALQGALLGIGTGPALGLTAACCLAMAALAAAVTHGRHQHS
jgi:fucose permease